MRWWTTGFLALWLGLFAAACTQARSANPGPAALPQPQVWAQAFTPTPPPTPSPTWTPTAACLAGRVLEGNDAVYTLAPKGPQNHVWVVENRGACPWEGKLILAIAPGSTLARTRQVPLPTPVPPGGQVRITLQFTAPREFGEYQGRWGLMTGDGQVIPLVNGPMTLRVTVPTPTPIPSPTPFRGALLFAYRTVDLTPGQLVNFDDGQVEVEYGYNGPNDQGLGHVGDHVFFVRTYEWPPMFDTCYYAPYDGVTNAILNPQNKIGWVYCFTTNEKRVGALVIQRFYVQRGTPHLVITYLTWAPKNPNLP